MSYQPTTILGIQRLVLGLRLKGLKALANPFAKLLDRLLLFDRLNRYLCSYDASVDYPEFCIRSRDYFDYSYTDLNDLVASIPEQGPCVIIANHPTGFVESMVLPELIFKKRNDLKILANEMLTDIVSAKPHIIPIDVYSRKSSLNAIRSCSKWLSENGVLLVFPAGEISDYCAKQKSVRDIEWSSMPFTLAVKHKSKLIHVFVEGKNSKWFYWLSKLNRTARIALISRELYNKKNDDFRIHSSSTLKMGTFSEDKPEQLARYFYNLDYALPKRSFFYDIPVDRVPVSAPKMKNLVVAEDVRARARREVANLAASFQVYSLKGYVVFNAQGNDIPHVLNLIQYEREITFRSSGMGTGNEKDGDEFDEKAQHLFIWDTKKDAFVGAYRYQIVSQQSAPGYLSKCYQINKEAWLQQDACLECNRAFIVDSYQKSFVGLLCLWRGLAKMVVKHKEVRYLAGVTSIAATGLPQKLVDLVSVYTDTLAKQHAYIADNFKAHQPYVVKNEIPKEIKLAVQQCRSIQQFENVFYQLTGHKYTLPVLFSKYELIGLKFLDTSVDPAFGDCIDVLGVWDIKAGVPDKARLFFGEDGVKVLTNRFACDKVSA